MSHKKSVTQMTANGDACFKHRAVIEFLLAKNDVRWKLSAETLGLLWKEVLLVVR
jgi:hypothetical protein